ncbi:MAG: hypothetical protein ACYSW0_06325 [Planctomycetota bacterium]|jgi:hypothetical protein
MEIIKRKILLEDYIYRGYVDVDLNDGTTIKYGDLTATTFNVNVFIQQEFDDMGIGTDLPFKSKDGSDPYYSPLIEKLNFSGLTFNFMNGATTNIIDDGTSPSTRYPNKVKDDYYISGNILSGLTEDRLDVVTSYDNTQKYKPLFNLESGVFDDYKGVSFSAVTRVINNDNLMPLNYIIDGDGNEIIDVSNPQPNRGIFLKTYSGLTRLITGTIFEPYNIPLTEIYYKSQGFNETNTVYSAMTKEEYLFGITVTPEVQNDVLIDRGVTTIIQSHMQLSEITNMGDLVNYGNGYYKIQK